MGIKSLYRPAKWSLAFLFLLMEFRIGLIREELFILMNSFIKNIGDPGFPLYFEKLIFSFIAGWLYWIKWPLTIIFCFIFLLIALIVTYVLYNRLFYFKITILFYLLFFVIAGLSVLAGLILNEFYAGYSIAHTFIKLLQSPLPLLLLIPFFEWYKKNKN